jgi:hypothetical protein
MLEKDVGLEEIKSLPVDSSPVSLFGADDVRPSKFKATNSRRESINADLILASGAPPTLFRAVHANIPRRGWPVFAEPSHTRASPYGPDETWL